jgi:hypothetical protein
LTCGGCDERGDPQGYGLALLQPTARGFSLPIPVYSVYAEKMNVTPPDLAGRTVKT